MIAWLILCLNEFTILTILPHKRIMEALLAFLNEPLCDYTLLPGLCSAVLKSGDRKGEECGGQVSPGRQYCGKHWRQDLSDVKTLVIKPISGIKNVDNKFEDMVAEYLLERAQKWTIEELKRRWNGYHQPLSKSVHSLSNNDNIPTDVDIFISQPYGSQKPPDFLLLRRKGSKLLVVKWELKSTDDWRSLWNCSLPKPEIGWVYTHYNTKWSMAFSFLGVDCLAPDEHSRLEEFDKKMKAIVGEHPLNGLPFSYYPRQMWTQEESYPFKRGAEYKQRVISFLRNMSTEESTTMIQPMWPHLPVSEPNESSMVVSVDSLIESEMKRSRNDQLIFDDADSVDTPAFPDTTKAWGAKGSSVASGPLASLTQNEQDVVPNQMSSGEYNELSIRYSLEKPRHHRDTHGQFFTSYSQVEECLQILPKFKKGEIRILEPSCGTGQFLDRLKARYDGSTLVAVEKDKDIVDQLNILDKGVLVDLTLLNMDFLQFRPEEKFDLIIGNPPYVELSDYAEVDYKSPCVRGRYNIYGLFIEHAMKLLKPKGLICFILPPALMSAPSFQLLRDHIKSQCNIRKILSLKNFSSEVSQDVNIYVFQKVSTAKLNDHHTTFYGGKLLFSTEKKARTEAHTPLSDHATVVTGSVVWNQVKKHVYDSRDDESGLTRLVYAVDVGNIGVGEFADSKVRKPYVKTKKSPVELPAIFVTRSKTLRHELVEEFDEPLIAENHVNVIQGELEELRMLDQYLGSERCSEYIKENAGTLNFSKTQLENLPIFADRPKGKIVFEEEEDELEAEYS